MLTAGSFLLTGKLVFLELFLEAVLLAGELVCKKTPTGSKKAFLFPFLKVGAFAA